MHQRCVRHFVPDKGTYQDADAGTDEGADGGAYTCAYTDSDSGADGIPYGCADDGANCLPHHISNGLPNALSV
jgi:hypothetical protein